MFYTIYAVCVCVCVCVCACVRVCVCVDACYSCTVNLAYGYTICVYAYIHAALFYYTLGNLSPIHRSSLHSIQLLIAVKSSFLVKYGADKILMPVIEEIKELERVRQALYACSIRSPDVNYVLFSQV